LGLLRKRKFFERFPLFSTYIAAITLISLLRLSTAPSPYYYFFAFWISEPFEILFAILALREIYRSLFRPHLRLWWFRLIFPIVSLATLLYALLKAILYPPVEASPVISMIISSETGAQYLIAALSVLSLALVKFFKIYEHLLERRLTAGFAVSSSGNLVSVIIRSVSGTRFNSLTIWVVFLANMVGGLLWIIALSRSQDIAGPGFPEGLTPLQASTTLKSYLQTVRKILKS
jgi:hypothetical protein